MSDETFHVGQRVRIVRLGTTDGMLIADKYLAWRMVGATGVLEGMVGGHGGDVWWVRQEAPVASTVAVAYAISEMVADE